MALRDNFAELGAADFAPDSVAVPLPERRPTGRDFSAGVRRGARGLESALRAVAGDTAGAKYAAAQAAAVPARFQSYEDISSPGDAVDYAQQTLGEQVPNLGLMAAGGGLGGLGARAAFGRAAQAAGARIGASQASAAAQGGEMINELRGQGLQPDAFTAGAAELAGVLDVAGLEGLGRGLVASATREAVAARTRASVTKSVLLGAAAGAARGLAAEEPAELAQEGLAIMNRIHAQPGYASDSEDIAKRLKETAVATAVVGGIPGAAAGTIGGLSANTTPERPESSQSAPVPEVRPQDTGPVRVDGDATPSAKSGRPEAPIPENLEAGPTDTTLGAGVPGGQDALDSVPPPSTSAEYQAEFDAMRDPQSSRDAVLITPYSDGRVSSVSIPENAQVVDAGPAGTLVTTDPAKAAEAQDEVAQTGALSAESQGRLLFNGAADGIPEAGNAEVIGRNAEGVQATNIVVDTQNSAATQRAVDEAAAQNPGGSVEVQPITPETTASHLANLRGAIHGQESPQAPHAAETGQDPSLLDQEIGALAQQDEAPSISYDFNPDDEDPTSVNPFANHLSVTGGPSGRVETQFAQHNVVRPLRTLYPGVEITPPSKAGPGRASIEFPDRAVRQDPELHSASMFHAIRGAFEFGKKDRGAIVTHLPGEEGKAKFHINPRGLEAIGRQIPGHTDDPAINAMAGLGLLQAKGFTFPELKAAKNPDAWVRAKLGRVKPVPAAKPTPDDWRNQIDAATGELDTSPDHDFKTPPVWRDPEPVKPGAPVRISGEGAWDVEAPTPASELAGYEGTRDPVLETEAKIGDQERQKYQVPKHSQVRGQNVSALPALGTRVSTPQIRTTQEAPAAPGPSNQELIAQLEADRSSLQALAAKQPLDAPEQEHLTELTKRLALLRAAGDTQFERTETREIVSPSVPERVTKFVQRVYEDLGLKLNTQIIAQRDLEQRIRMLEAGDEDARIEAQSLREALSDRSFAARTIYNQHYRDVGRRAPVIVLSEQALKGKWAPILTHEIGHVVARAWYDGLSPELQAHLFDELTDGGKYPDSFEETFAEKFVEWYRNRSSLTGRLKDAMNSLYAQLKKLWASVSRQEREFRAKYPKFDEFLSSMVGVHGKMPVLSRSMQETWTKNLANPYAGLPLQIGAVKFHDMSVEEAYIQGLTQWNAAKNWADTRMKTAVGQNQVAERYYRKAKENADGIKRMSRLVFMPDAARVRQYLPEFADLIAPLPGKEMKATAVIPPTNIGGGVPAGTRSMTAPIHTAVKRTLAHWMPEVDKILGMLPTKPVATIGGKSWGKWIDTAHPDYQATVDGLINALPYDQLTPAAKEIRKYFRRMLAYMHGRGVRVGQLQNYFPRMWDLVGLDDNKAEVIDTFEKIFAARSELPVRQDSHGNTVLFRDAREAAEFEYNRIMTGAVDSLFSLDPAAEDSGLRGQSFRFARSRTFSDDEYRQFGLNRWVSRDLVNILNTYTRLGVRRAVWQWATGIPKDQRVGRRGEYWKQRFEAAGLDPAVMGSPVAAVELRMAEMARDGEIGADDYRELMTKRLPALFGTLSVGSNPALRKWTGRLLMYETLRTMAWSTFASFGDLGVTAWRGESVGLALKSMRELISAEDRKTQLGLLKAIGLYLDDFTDHALMMDMTSGDPLAGGSQKITQLFFHANGMHKLSQATLMFASRLGQNYIRDHGEKAAAGDASSLKRLKELHPDLTPQVATGASFESDPTLQLALHKFVNEAHIHDQQGLTPWWFSDIRFKLLAQLKSFQFKYWHLVGRLMWERMKERPTLYGAAMPLATFFVATAPLAALGLETKEFLRRGLLPEVRRAPKPLDMQEKMWRVFMAVQPNIYLALGETAHDASSHGQAAVTALAGPTVSHAMMVMSRTADEFIPQSVPIVAQVPWLRAGVRGVLRENFGFGVRDEEE